MKIKNVDALKIKYKVSKRKALSIIGGCQNNSNSGEYKQGNDRVVR